MKVKILYLLSLLILFLSSCSKDQSILKPEEERVGGLTLTIDKKNVPSNVVKVIAYLTREGYESFTGELNLLTETSADIFLEDIYSGKWHLLVEALNENETVVYKGETDVTVLEGITTEVNLVLFPAASGTGSIYIYVTWGSSSEWIDYKDNPVLKPFGNGYDNYGISQPVLLKEGSKYLMWYMTDAGSAVKYVFYAESEDGINWVRPLSSPVLSPGNPGTWDSWAVHPGAVIKDSGIYRMYYVAWSETHSNWNIGLATSRDGISWEKYSDPVLYGADGWEYQIGSSSIIKEGNNFLLYYYGISRSGEVAIGAASSADGIEWSKNENNPVLIPENSWEGRGVYYPSVIKDGNEYKMVYMNKESNAFGMASSEDGIHWTKLSSEPFFKNESTADNWAYDIAYPHIFKKGNEYRIYYSGIGQNSSGYSIGFMKKTGNKLFLR